jgi:sulfur relay (sulfurtransferase) DsrC/TusE family protein
MLKLRGVIENVRYRAGMVPNLKTYHLEDFDINTAHGCGIIQADQGAMGYSKWVSPKRTRSYPFARIYNTYATSKRITIIPIIKDEGINGDCDRINFITLSMMNLLNIYVILVWYDSAKRHPKRAGKITSQKFPTAYVNARIAEISEYKQSALHWNIMHFERDFEVVYHRAVSQYQMLSAQLGVAVHESQGHLDTLKHFLSDGQFNRAAFRNLTLSRSLDAVNREIATTHAQEMLVDGAKAYISLTNFLGGEYHLTIDEIYQEDNVLIIQEAKNTSRNKLPSINDIKDGLLKLILYANIDQLYQDDERVHFQARLKLTGDLKGRLLLPTTPESIADFADLNQLRPREVMLIHTLNQEATYNRLKTEQRLSILLTGQS